MAQYNLISNTCQNATDDTVAGALSPNSKLGVFNFMSQLSELAANPNQCGGRDATLQWTRNVSEDLIACCGDNTMDYKFFEKEFSSTPKKIDTKNYFQRYHSNENENVLAGSGNLLTGSTNKFILHPSSHNSTGTGSSLFEGMFLYNYRTAKMVKITTINNSTPKQFIINVVSTDGSNVSINKGDKFIRIPAVAVGGSSCPTGQTTMNTHWTTKQVNKLRLRTKWVMEMQVDRPYADVMKFAPFVDKTNKVTWQALPTMKIRAMQEVTQAANLFMFIGNKISNPAIAVDDFTAGEGMLESIKGAGNIRDFDPTKGFSLEYDFEPIIMAEDAMKRTTDWVLYGSLQFKAGLVRRTNNDTKGNGTLPYDYASHTRTGNDHGTINKSGFESYSYLGRNIRYKEWGVLSTSNGLGNGMFPQTGILLANNGLRNSQGDEVPPVEFFNSKSQAGEWQTLMENDRNQWLLQGCESIEGDIIKTMFWMVHCPNRHYYLNPVACS